MNHFTDKLGKEKRKESFLWKLQIIFIGKSVIDDISCIPQKN